MSLDIEGQRFGKLVALQKVGKDKHRHEVWQFRCDCGNVVEKVANYVKQGRTRSCGCLNKERIETFKNHFTYKHGGYGTRLYRIWAGMKARCYIPSATNHKYYENVEVCDEWLQFEIFKEWALSNGYNDDLTIDRIDGKGNYEPSNCRWVSRSIQSNNRNYNRKIKVRGIEKNLWEWLKLLGYKSTTTFYRWSKKGMSDSEIIEKMMEMKGVYLT